MCYKTIFLFFVYLNIIKFFRSTHFGLVISSKLPTFIYPLCFKKQTLELLLHLSFKLEVPTNNIQDISFLSFRIYLDVKRLFVARPSNLP